MATMDRSYVSKLERIAQSASRVMRWPADTKRGRKAEADLHSALEDFARAFPVDAAAIGVAQKGSTETAGADDPKSAT